MMERADSVQKLYTRMRLWEFPDQYVIEPTDGSSGSSLSVSRVDGSMKLIGQFHPLLCLRAVFFSSIILIYNRSILIILCILLRYCFALTDEVPECSSIRVPKIFTIFGVIGILRLLAGEQSQETHSNDLVIEIVHISDYCMSLFVLRLKFLCLLYWHGFVGVHLYLYDCGTM